MRIAIIRNTMVVKGKWAGIDIDAGDYYTLEREDFVRFPDLAKVYASVANGELLVNDGMNDLSPLDGWNWITGNKQDVTIAQTSEVGDKKIWTHNSAKPVIDGKSLYSQWVGHGDDIVNNNIGTGEFCGIKNEVGIASKSIDIDLCNTDHLVYIHEGYASWSNASFGDVFTAYVVARSTVLQSSTNLDYDVDLENRVIVAPGGPGTGSVGFASSPTLVPCSGGFWDYDGTLIYAPGKDGAYNIYDIDVEVNAFIHKVPVLGNSNGYCRFVSDDVSLLPPGYFLRIKTENVSNTAWELVFIITTFREKTVNGIHDGV